MIKLQLYTYQLSKAQRNVYIYEARAKLALAFATLPDEAFTFMCGQLYNIGQTAGGFSAPSRAAFRAIGLLASSYLENNQRHS